MKKNKLKNLNLNKRSIAKLSDFKMLRGGTVSFGNTGILYDIHTNPLDANTNPLPTAVDTNTNVGDGVTEITETAPAATGSNPIGTNGPPPMNGLTVSCPGGGVC